MPTSTELRESAGELLELLQTVEFTDEELAPFDDCYSVLEAMLFRLRVLALEAGAVNGLLIRAGG